MLLSWKWLFLSKVAALGQHPVYFFPPEFSPELRSGWPPVFPARFKSQIGGDDGVNF